MGSARSLRWFALAGLALLTIEAAATITQVDGTIVPVSNRLQDALDGTPDGLPDVPPNTALDSWLDAAQVPQVFLPNPAGVVVFTDLAEGAGFENSIGWYNVGDDVFTPIGRARNLHPILGCGVPMENHTTTCSCRTLTIHTEA